MNINDLDTTMLYQLFECIKQVPAGEIAVLTFKDKIGFG